MVEVVRVGSHVAWAKLIVRALYCAVEGLSVEGYRQGYCRKLETARFGNIGERKHHGPKLGRPIGEFRCGIDP